MHRPVLRATIVIFLLPKILASQTIQPGLPPYGSFEVGATDVTNRQNLNTLVSLPITSTTGRGIDIDVAIYYNSLAFYPNSGAWTPLAGWNFYPLVGGSVAYKTTSSQQNCGPAAPSGGPMLLPIALDSDWLRKSRRRLYYGTKLTYLNYIYTEPNGTRHAVPVSGTEDGCGGGYSGTAKDATDGSGILLDATASQDPLVRLRSGTVLFVNNTRMEDRNGNYISYTTPSGETDYTDSAGHLALKVVSSSSSVKYEYQDATGAYQTVTLNPASFNVKTAFACSGITEYSGTWSLPASLVYPNGWTYTFSYEATPGNSAYTTGRLSKMTLPNGGYIQYTFGSANDGINCSDGSIVSLTRGQYDGTNTATWQFARALNGSNWQTTVTAPQMPWDTAANQSVYTFNSSGQETSEQFYQGSASGGTLLRTINTTWASNASPATKITILETTVSPKPKRRTTQTANSLCSRSTITAAARPAPFFAPQTIATSLRAAPTSSIASQQKPLPTQLERHNTAKILPTTAPQSVPAPQALPTTTTQTTAVRSPRAEIGPRQLPTRMRPRHPAGLQKIRTSTSSEIL